MITSIQKTKMRDAQLKTQDTSWRSHWAEIADYMAPASGRYLQSDNEVGNKHNKGDKRHQKIINSSASKAQRIISAGLQSGLTSPSRPWFVLTLADKALADLDSVRLWLEDVRQRMLAVFAGSNFYSAVHSVYEELPVFGTGAMLIEEDLETTIRFRPFTIGEYSIYNNDRLQPAGMHRRFVYTAQQLVDKFGEKNVGYKVNAAMASNQPLTEFEVVQVIAPNADGDSSRFPYKAQYFLSGESEFLNQSGYFSKPFVAVRWSVVGTDSYGTKCPGMDTLGDVKMLQKLEEKKLKALDKSIDPPLNAPGELMSRGVNLVPGGVNYYDNLSGRPAVTPVHVPSVNLNDIRQEIRDVENRIKEGFYNDLFLAILADDKRMTATEVAKRYEEKLLMIGPVVERLQSEFLDPIISRTYQVMDQAGAIPELPEELEGQSLRVSYVGILAQAQKIVSTQAIEQVAAFTGNLAAVNPGVLDKVDMDEIVEQYADSLGVPPKLIRSAIEVNEIREQRAQQERALQAQQNALASAEGAKTLSQADMGGNNALTALMSGL